MLYEPDFLKKNSFSPLNSLFFRLPEPQTFDFQPKINFKQALRQFQKEKRLKQFI